MIKVLSIKIFFIFLFLLCTFSLFSEQFRVYEMHICTINSETPYVQKTIGINDSLAIQIPQDRLFLDGIDINVKIPELVATYWDSVAYSIYYDVTPEPSTSIIDYSGVCQIIETVPAKLSLNLQIPLNNKKDIINPYSVVIPKIPSITTNYIILRMQLVMKGIPEDFENSLFTVEVKPILANIGVLDLNLSGDSDEISVYVDDEQYSERQIFLDPGIHHLSIVSEKYRNEVRTFTIEQAKHTKLDIELKDSTPELLFAVPKNTKITFDDVLIEDTSNPYLVTPGEHKIHFVLGDYELVRTLQISNGKTYTVSLSVNIDIIEE